MEKLTVEILVVVFVASVVRSAFGFGEALIAVPLLALFLPIRVAAPLAVLISVAIAAVILLQDWRKVHLRSSGWLFAPTLAGIPLGIWLLRSAHQELVKAALAVVIILFSGFFMLGKRPPHLEHDSHAWLLGCGFAAGVLGGAYGINGPPLAVYGSMRRWSPQHFRATLQGYFLPASAIGMLGYGISGLWTARGHALFLCRNVCRASCDLCGPLVEPSHARRSLSALRPRRCGCRRNCSAGSGTPAPLAHQKKPRYHASIGSAKIAASSPPMQRNVPSGI